MKEEFKLASLPDANGAVPGFLSAQHTETIRAFHKTFPQYSETPLAHLPETAALLGLGDVFIKDESKRFGLNAFKVLGGSYAIGCLLAEKLGKSIAEVSHASLTSPEAKAKLGEMVLPEGVTCEIEVR